MNNSSQSSSYKWVVLLVFTLVAGVSQMLWLNFAPLISLLQKTYSVDELTASTLILVFPLLYVLLSIPSGALIDRKGYKFSIGWASAVMALFSILRIFDSSFTNLLIAQIGIAIAQPFIINGISKLVVDWFPKEQNALATGLGTVGMFVGMALGMALTPALVQSLQLSGAMMIFSVIAIVSALAFILLCKTKNFDLEKSSSLEDLKSVAKNSNLILLFIISFLALGFFNGLTTWLELILKPNGINAEDAGLIGGLLIIGGIVGSAIIPALSDKLKKRKPFLIICSIFAALLTWPLCTQSNLTSLLVLGFLTGALFLPGYALLLTMTEEIAGSKRAGAATALLMLMGNAGGVVVILLMDAVKSSANNFTNSIIVMIALMVASLIVALFTKETFRG